MTTDVPDELTSDQREFDALSAVVRALQPLDREAKQRVLSAVTTFLGFDNTQVKPSASLQRAPSQEQPIAGFSEDRTPSPKEFMLSKRAQTDVEKVACLGYYLAHYRDTPHFKTLDLSTLNTEAAQLKFSNAANAVDNAAKAGLLAPAVKGMKQLSALGELYVQALPDRAAARDAVAHQRKRKRRRSGKGVREEAEEGSTTSDEDE
jgi:hypothetical protein